LSKFLFVKFNLKILLLLSSFVPLNRSLPELLSPLLFSSVKFEIGILDGVDICFDNVEIIGDTAGE
jgi:hypothetical protein